MTVLRQRVMKQMTRLNAWRWVSVSLIATMTVSAGYLMQTATLPTIQIGDQPKSISLDVKPKDLTISCPGAAIRTGGSSGVKVGKLDRFGSAAVFAGQNLTSGQILQTRFIGANDVNDVATTQQVVNIGNQNGLQLIAHDANGEASQSSYLLAAVQTQLLKTDSLSGLLGASCQPAKSEQWLVGAETSTGRESLLLLQNNSSLDSIVDIELYAEGGLVQAAGLTGITVGANDFEVVPLASYAPKAKTLAVHVLSKGGLISAWVQQKTIRGTTPGGIDLISALSTAQTQLLIPGLFIRGSKLGADLMKTNEDYKDLVPSLQVFVPGEKDATFTAQIISSTQGAFGTVIKQTVTAGQINRFDISGLSDGDYAVVIDSDQPIFAQVLFSRVSSGKTPDFTYLSPSPVQTTIRATVAPTGALSKLQIMNPSDTAVTVKLSGTDKESVTVDKYSALTVTATAGKLISISSDGLVAATLVIDVDGQITSAQLLDYRNVGSKVSVLVR